MTAPDTGQAREHDHPFFGERCVWHGVDEPRDADTFQVCFECNHVYPTEADLLAAHNRVLLAMGDPPRTTLGSLRYFCGECTHDF